MHVIRPSLVLLYALGLVVVLGGGAYLGARLLGSRPGNGDLPSAADALHRIPVWLAEGEDVRVVLRPYYQWPEADRANDALLSAYLFPDGARFAVLWIASIYAGWVISRCRKNGRTAQKPTLAWRPRVSPTC